MARINYQIGDLIEIKTPAGLAYAQYTHDGESHGQLIRVLPGLYSSRPHDLASVANRKELYFIFFTLEYALRARQIEIASHQPVPEWAKPFPIMRKGGGWNEEDETSVNWHIGHGLRLYTLEEMRQSQFVRELSPEQKRISIAQICSFPALVDLITRGWTPERDDELIATARREKGEHGTRSVPVQHAVIQHFLYFKKKSDAERAAQKLIAKGWKVEVQMGGDGESWLTLGNQPAPIEEQITEIREELERLARDLNGEYDGWGAPV